jgi:hypothetical protein
MMFEKSRILRLLAVVIIAGVCFLRAEAQTTLYVSVSTGADGPVCGTAGSPCASLHGALTVLSSNPGSIFITAGTYNGTSNTNLNIAVSSVSVVGNGCVIFTGGGSVQGWTLSGNNVLIDNSMFSNFNTTGTFERACKALEERGVSCLSTGCRTHGVPVQCGRFGELWPRFAEVCSTTVTNGGTSVLEVSSPVALITYPSLGAANREPRSD